MMMRAAPMVSNAIVPGVIAETARAFNLQEQL